MITNTANLCMYFIYVYLPVCLCICQSIYLSIYLLMEHSESLSLSIAAILQKDLGCPTAMHSDSSKCLSFTHARYSLLQIIVQDDKS